MALVQHVSIFLYIYSNRTLGARDFSSAVSGFCPTPKIPTAREKNLWYPGYSNRTSFPMDPDEIIGKYIIVTYSCICFLLVSWLRPTSKLQDWEPGSSTEERVSRKCESDDNFCYWRLCSAPLASANSNLPFPSSPAYTCFLFSLSQTSLRRKEAST